MNENERRDDNETSGITRRALLVGAGAAVLASGARTALAGSHEHADHAGHGDHAGHSAAGNNPTVTKAAMDCIASGNVCIEHCLVQLRDGNTAMADCAAAVTEMHAVCTGLATLAAQNSKHLGKYAAACLEICKTCEAECRKHEKMHAACKACADSCKACIAECEKLVA
jgi:Cys-rich four helix bundle protein (predicted Tat secretion target)